MTAVKKRIVHRNLMKRFHVRNTALVALVATRLAVDPDDQLDKVDVKHLHHDQRLQLMTLLHQYRTIFDPDPGFTTMVQHKISLIPNAKPCRQTPYRLSPDKTRWVNSQIQFLLKDGIIEESLSPWYVPNFGGAQTRWFGSALR